MVDYSRRPRRFPAQRDDEETVEEPMAEEMLWTSNEQYRRIDLNDLARDDVYVYNERFYVPANEASSPVIILVREDVFVAGADDVVPGATSP